MKKILIKSYFKLPLIHFFQDLLKFEMAELFYTS
jgi:hypothetical protein